MVCPPEKTHRRVERLRELIARHRAVGEADQDRIAERHVGLLKLDGPIKSLALKPKYAQLRICFKLYTEKSKAAARDRSGATAPPRLEKVLAKCDVRCGQSLTSAATT